MKYYVSAKLNGKGCNSIKWLLKDAGYTIVRNHRSTSSYSRCCWVGYDTVSKTTFSADNDARRADYPLLTSISEFQLSLARKEEEVSQPLPPAIPSALLILPDSITSVVCNGITYTRQMTWVASAK